jgi:hypothetical protein
MSLDALVTTLAEVIRGGLHTVMPAEVVSFNASTQTATIQPVIRHARATEGGGIEQYLPDPIPNVPVAFFRAGGGAVYIEPEAGDRGILLIAERSTDEFRAQARSDTTPADLRRFSMADALFLPAQVSPADPMTAAMRAANALVLAHDAQVKLGSGSASNAVSLAPLVSSMMTTLKTWLDLHTHTDPISGTTGPPVAPSPSPSDTGSSKVLSDA